MSTPNLVSMPTSKILNIWKSASKLNRTPTSKMCSSASRSNCRPNFIWTKSWRSIESISGLPQGGCRSSINEWHVNPSGLLVEHSARFGRLGIGYGPACVQKGTFWILFVALYSTVVASHAVAPHRFHRVVLLQYQGRRQCRKQCRTPTTQTLSVRT